MARPSFATQGGVIAGVRFFHTNTTPQCQTNYKPSYDGCRCCSGDNSSNFQPDPRYFINVVDPLSIRLL